MRPFLALFLRLTLPVALLAASLFPREAAADSPEAVRPHAYAIIVGSNTGGEGQEPLHYAEDDARRFAAVLTELGHYEGSDVTVLIHPDPAHVMGAIDAVGAKVRASAAQGEEAQVVFYYSGHARANAINLGGEELPLTTLRQRLGSLPDALTIVVLDACQSGSFSRVKGAGPAADFTYNSVAGLTQKGLAVMASSTSQELSQESDDLHASYFTSHLVTALRGAGDADGDGRVSLDEAYRYAYRRTLASTARTQVGEQHVTLETDLAGQGEVAMTYPVEARAQLELPGALDAHVLVQLHPSMAVLAEVQKAAGSPVRLALVAGAYDVVVGQGSRIVQCSITLVNDRVTVLETTSCTPVIVQRTTAKGERSKREIDRWSVELAAGFIWRETDAYTSRLQVFGYAPQTSLLSLPSARVTVGASRELAPHLSGLLQFGTLTGDTYVRSIESSTDTVDFNAFGGALYVRASTDVLEHVLGIYGQGGVGMTVGTVTVQTVQAGVPPSATTTYSNYLLSGAVGMTVRFPEVATLFLQAGYDRAPAIHDLIGDTHDSGGFSGVIGARFRLGDDR
jgi:hypothetical protein